MLLDVIEMSLTISGELRGQTTVKHTDAHLSPITCPKLSKHARSSYANFIIIAFPFHNIEYRRRMNVQEAFPSTIPSSVQALRIADTNGKANLPTWNFVD